MYARSGWHNYFVALILQGRGLRILEALSATGLRSIRYALEIPRAASIVANDLSPDAFEAMKKNIEHNGVADRVTPSCQEARWVCPTSWDGVWGMEGMKGRGGGGGGGQPHWYEGGETSLTGSTLVRGARGGKV